MHLVQQHNKKVTNKSPHPSIIYCLIGKKAKRIPDP